MSIENGVKKPELLFGPISEDGSVHFYRTDVRLFGTIYAVPNEDLQPVSRVRLELPDEAEVEVDVDVNPTSRGGVIKKAIALENEGKGMKLISTKHL